MQSDWDIVKRGWYAHVLGEAEHTFTDPVEAVETLRVSWARARVRVGLRLLRSRRSRPSG